MQRILVNSEKGVSYLRLTRYRYNEDPNTWSSPYIFCRDKYTSFEDVNDVNSKEIFEMVLTALDEDYINDQTDTGSWFLLSGWFRNHIDLLTGEKINNTNEKDKMFNQKDWKQFKMLHEEMERFNVKASDIAKRKQDKEIKNPKNPFDKAYNETIIRYYGYFPFVYNSVKAPYENTLEGYLNWIAEDKPLFINKLEVK